MFIYASATASDRKKALTKKESLQNTANNIRKIQADRKKTKLQKEIDNSPTKKIEALTTAYTKQLEKIENAILAIKPILENKELLTPNYHTSFFSYKIKTFEKLSLLVRNSLLISNKEIETYKAEQEKIKAEAKDKAKNNKSLNSNLNVNGIYLDSKNTQKIIAQKQEAIDLENFETQRKINNQLQKVSK